MLHNFLLENSDLTLLLVQLLTPSSYQQQPLGPKQKHELEPFRAISPIPTTDTVCDHFRRMGYPLARAGSVCGMLHSEFSHSQVKRQPQPQAPAMPFSASKQITHTSDLHQKNRRAYTCVRVGGWKMRVKMPENEFKFVKFVGK